MEADRQSIPAVLSEQAQSLLYWAAFNGSQVQYAYYPMRLLSTHSRSHACELYMISTHETFTVQAYKPAFAILLTVCKRLAKPEREREALAVLLA